LMPDVRTIFYGKCWLLGYFFTESARDNALMAELVTGHMTSSPRCHTLYELQTFCPFTPVYV